MAHADDAGLVSDDEAALRARLAAAVPPNVRTVCATLTEAGHQAVTVGGAVRDALIGRVPGDWDVATSAHPDQVMALFRRTIPTGLQHGTVTVITGKGEASHVEVTTFRGEGAYTDARRPDSVTFGVPLIDDLARRDLRINAMAYDPATDQLIDPYDGRADLAGRKLRAVGPTGDVYADAVARFSEDGLRVMRAVRFAAVLEFDLDPDTERGIAPALPSLAKVSRERVCEELRKLLGAREPSRALAIAERAGVVALVLPALDTGLARWGAHGAGRPAAVAAWLARIDAAAPALRLAALLVELGDPAADPAVRDISLARTVSDVLKALKFSNAEASAAAQVASLARAGEAARPPAALRRLFAQVGREHAHAAVGLWRAHAPCAPAALAAAEGILTRGEPLGAGDLALTGKDLMSELGLPAGPALGRTLAALLDAVLDEPARNTRAALLELARALGA